MSNSEPQSARSTRRFLQQPVAGILVLIWLGWAAAILGFQWLVEQRLDVQLPDHARMWTAEFTQAGYTSDRKYLLEPFMQRSVAFDSEYYLSIAIGGYEDLLMRRVQTPRGAVSQNYAFFPLYPLLIRVVAAPLGWLGMVNPIGRVALAGVIVSLLGTLAGLMALYDLGRDVLDDQAALRSVFYLLIFPSAVFMAVVYTEGLFIGLSFTSLALAQRGKVGWAALLAVPAFFTRPVGVLLVIPAGIAWLQQAKAGLRASPAGFAVKKPLLLKLLPGAAALLVPVLVYLVWHQSAYGQNFLAVEEVAFGHKNFDFARSAWAWQDAWNELTSGHPNARVLHGLEFASMLLGFAASGWLGRRSPGLALYSLALLIVPSFSGQFQSMIRYVLVVPANYLFLAHLGRKPAFDRLWTVLSVLLLGLETLLFTFDMWVA